MRLVEIKGSQVLDFADYLNSSEWILKTQRVDFEKLGNALFKLGFSLYTEPNARFLKEEGMQGFGWSVVLPSSQDTMGLIHIIYTDYIATDHNPRLIIGRDSFTLTEIMSEGIDACLAEVKAKAISTT